MYITLKNLAFRLSLDTELLTKHPERKGILERKIAKTKELIVKCVSQNADNPALESITL